MATYAYYDFVLEWPELVVAVNNMEARLRRTGRPIAADRLLKAYTTMRGDLQRMASAIAVLGTEELRKSERQTRVRPDTLGQGGPRLGDSLVAEPVQPSLLPGSVGVANEDLLDHNVPWWITNEIGSTARVGGRIFGYFSGASGDEAPPEATAFREHPLFTAGASPVSGLGIIENPIPARRFIRDAIPAIDREWKAAFHAIKSTFDAEVTAVLATPR